MDFTRVNPEQDRRQFARTTPRDASSSSTTLITGAWRQPEVQPAAFVSRTAADAVATPGWKRALDLACILVLLPLLLPLAAALAVLVKAVSSGPIFFRQERVGYRGRRFVCLKFRTMHPGTSTATHEDYCRDLIASDAPMTKLDDSNDDRIIPFGPMIRAMGLDELPQLVNVIRGQMSLVGPRPCLPTEYEAYQPAQRRRFDVVPGLTGLWQVSGKNSTTFARMIELDLEYIRRQSLWLDLQIMGRTIPVLLRAAAGALRRRWHRLAISVFKRHGDPQSPAG